VVDDAHAFEPPLALGTDVYRRRILIRATAPGEVVADLEDDFHHFVVTLRHDGHLVESVDAQSIRWPWSTCPGAAEPLRALAGAPLTLRWTHAARWTNPALNCTHQFDSAAHAITHAKRVTDGIGSEVRQYDVEIAALLARGEEPARNRLWVDGRLALQWSMQPAREPLDLPPELAAAPWRGGFLRWADEHLEPDAAERACVLRRACDIGMGRGMALDDVPVASELPGTMRGVCHSLQPEIAPVAFRNVGSIRDFASDPDALPHTD
jgi:Protein of unknown function (DUF2889)